MLRINFISNNSLRDNNKIFSRFIQWCFKLNDIMPSIISLNVIRCGYCNYIISFFDLYWVANIRVFINFWWTIQIYRLDFSYRSLSWNNWNTFRNKVIRNHFVDTTNRKLEVTYRRRIVAVFTLNLIKKSKCVFIIHSEIINCIICFNCNNHRF